MISSDYVRIRENPRISANELAKYLVASDAAKLGIIKRSKEVNIAPIVRYKEVKKALRNAMISPTAEKKIVNDSIQSFREKQNSSSLTAFVKDDYAKSVDVLTAYQGMRNQLAGYDYSELPGKQPILIVEGVEVSINCDLLISQNKKVGALIYRVTKPDEDESDNARIKRKNMGLYVATLVRMQVGNNFAASREPTNKLCWSVDVQYGDVHVCPPSITRRKKDIQSACKFISMMWHSA